MKVWPVEKYARLVSSAANSAKADASGSASGSAAKKTDGVWQHYSSKGESIQMVLMESNHFMISSGTMIFESFSLWEAQKWLKVVTKGDSAMFMYRLKDENRRFRVKFSPVGPSSTALETCREFTTVLAPLVPIREMDSSGGSTVVTSTRDKTDTSTRDKTSTCGIESTDSQLMGYEDTQFLDSQATYGYQQASLPLQPDESSLIPVPDLAKLVQSESKSLGRAYADTNFPTEQLGDFIRLCLTDANFPAFVDSVEKELNSMTGSA